jgi:hypothetical protein
MKWQYQLITVRNPLSAADIQSTLNEWGSEGWELVTAIEGFVSEDAHTLVLKRQDKNSN